MTASRSVVADLLDIEDMTQVELAAALNATQAAVSQWVSGARKPNERASLTIDRALRARKAVANEIDAGLRRGPVRIPEEMWEPAFRPEGRFRLPLRLEWSGSDRERWRDARNVSILLNAYVQVMVEGSASDIVTWVDPHVLAEHFDDVLWPRGYREPWRKALSGWGLL
jgi:transcriptional regulator with XRE-family HTH domain